MASIHLRHDARGGVHESSRRPGAVLAAMCGCTVLVLAFVASINLAVPKLAAGSLHPSSSQLLWVVDAYVVFFGALVIPGGTIGDRFCRKGVLLVGLVLFAVGRRSRGHRRMSR